MRRNLILGLVLSVAVSGAFAHHPTGKIKIDAAQKKQPAVTFDHGKHADTFVKDCTTCHHTEKGLTKTGTAVKVPKCSSCHMQAQGNMGTMADMSLTKNPMHVNCIDCHKTNKKGPTTCIGCHKKS